MGKIVAIGGGELRNLETLIIDKYIVNLTGKKHPRALFIPTASKEAEGYINLFDKVYSELGCITDTLLLIDSNTSDEEIKNKILSSDLIYVGGGNTHFMLNIWKQRKVDIYLKEALNKNIILSGLSAGAICWFKSAHSDAKSKSEDDIHYSIIDALGFIDGLVCPHFNDETRKNNFINIMKKSNKVGIALEDNCALIIIDDMYKVIKANENNKAYKFINGIMQELTNNSFDLLCNLYKNNS